MTLLLVGVIGALLMGLIPKSFYTGAVATRRLSAEKPFGGVVPAWASIAFQLYWTLFIGAMGLDYSACNRCAGADFQKTAIARR
jgi:hypothetical protein